MCLDETALYAPVVPRKEMVLLSKLQEKAADLRRRGKVQRRVYAL